MRSTIYRVTFAATAAFTAACSNTDSSAPMTPPATARRAVTPDANGNATVKQSVDRYVWLSCMNDGAGEAVHVTGELRYDVHSTQDGSGIYHFSIKSNTSNLIAVGLTSGTFFRGTMGERINSRAEDYLNSDVRISDMIRFAAVGSSDGYSLMATSHIIVDQGDYVVWDESWNEVCR